MEELDLTKYQKDILGKLTACIGPDVWFTIGDLWDNVGGFYISWMRRPNFTVRILVKKGALERRVKQDDTKDGLWHGHWEYRIAYAPPPPYAYDVRHYGPGHAEDGSEVAIVNQGWRVYRKSYHTHRQGNDIQRPREQQLPRERLLGVFETETAARFFAWKQAKEDRRL